MLEMQLKATSFVLTDLATGRLVAQALICPLARYVSILPHGASQIERRFLSAAQWKDVEHEVSVGISPGPIPRADAIAIALTGRLSDLVAQYLTVMQIEIESPSRVAEALDQCLRQAGSFDQGSDTRTP